MCSIMHLSKFLLQVLKQLLINTLMAKTKSGIRSQKGQAKRTRRWNSLRDVARAKAAGERDLCE